MMARIYQIMIPWIFMICFVNVMQIHGKNILYSWVSRENPCYLVLSLILRDIDCRIVPYPCSKFKWDIHFSHIFNNFSAHNLVFYRILEILQLGILQHEDWAHRFQQFSSRSMYEVTTLLVNLDFPPGIPAYDRQECALVCRWSSFQ